MKIRNLTSAVLAFALSAFAFTGCSSKEGNSSASDSGTSSVADNTVSTDNTSSDAADDTSAKTIIKVGATSTPHGEILEHIKSALDEQGYDLQITIYDDYVLPNKALADGELDANYFQHTPYLNSYNEANGTDLASAALIHYEPFGLYGNGLESVADVAKGASIVIPADDSNETRALLLLAQEGLITLSTLR